MITKRPKPPIWLRLTAILLGAFLILWIPFEDPHTGVALGLAAALCLWTTLYYLYPVAVKSWKTVLIYGLTGALAGIVTVPTTLLLMAIKTGLHAHPVADFTKTQVSDLVSRIPIWITAGLLIGLGVGLWRYLHPPDSPSN